MIYVVVSVDACGQRVQHGVYTSGEAAQQHAARLNDQWREVGDPRRARVVREVLDTGSSGVETVSAAGYGWPVVFGDDCAGYIHRQQIPATGVEWRKRESQRPGIASVPWINEHWWRYSPYWATHFPHPSQVDPCKLAYTPDEAYGLADRQVRIAPGRYLRKYFGDVLTEDGIQYWVLQWANRFAPVSLEIATSPDEIEYVYTHGPRSCMSYDASNYHSSCHPVRVYGDSDLALAYFRNKDGKIAGRALIWPAKMVYGRIYGDYERLQEALHAAGYAPGSFAGARVRKIMDGDAIVMPYIDGDANCIQPHDGEYWVLSETGIPCTLTDGYAQCLQCSSCYDIIDDIDYAYGDPSGGDDLYCESCYSDLFGSCEECGEVCYRDDLRYTDRGDLCDSCYEQLYAACGYCGEDYPIDTMLTGPDGVIRCEYCHSETVAVCEECDEGILSEDAYDGPDGVIRCESCHSKAVVVCEQCQSDIMRGDVVVGDDNAVRCRACADLLALAGVMAQERR